MFIIVPLFLLGSVTFMISQHLIEKNYGEKTELTLKEMSKKLEQSFLDSEYVYYSGIVNPAIQEILLMSKPEDVMYPNQYQLDKNKANQEVRRYLYHHPAVDYVVLITFNGEVFRPHSSYPLSITYEKLISHEIYEEIVELNGLPKWVGPYEYPELTGNDTFAQIRMVKDINRFKNKGVLIIWLSPSKLEKVLPNPATNPDRFMIVNEEGLIVVDNKNKLNGQQLSDFMSKPLNLVDNYKNHTALFNQEKSIISTYHLDKNDFVLISVASRYTVSSEIVTVRNWVGTILFFCVILALMFILLFVNRIARSIIYIVKLMKEVEKGDLTVRAKVRGNDETTLLSKGFNRLVVNIHDLLEKVKNEQERKKKAEMMLLQAQIHPHFLFNTLESINVLAVRNEPKKVQQMIQKLGVILRVSIQEKEEITIQEEIEHLKSYLHIQKFRFEDLFDYEIDIQSSIMSENILKLTLQPLVENCIQHGFEGIEYKGFIQIRAYEEDDNIIFFVTDNGKGIPAHILINFHYEKYQGKALLNEVETNNEERRGLGVKNVADRLRIHYGSTYGVLICSTIHDGTLVKIIIPKGVKGDEYES